MSDYFCLTCRGLLEADPVVTLAFSTPLLYQAHEYHLQRRDVRRCPACGTTAFDLVKAALPGLEIPMDWDRVVVVWKTGRKSEPMLRKTFE